MPCCRGDAAERRRDRPGFAGIESHVLRHPHVKLPKRTPVRTQGAVDGRRPPPFRVSQRRNSHRVPLPAAEYCHHGFLLLQDGRECIADALGLRAVDHSSKKVGEPFILNAGDDVLPAIRSEHGISDLGLLVRRKRPAADSQEVIGIRLGLDLLQTIHRTDEFNEIVDSTISLLGEEFRILTRPLQLVQNRMLRFFTGVVQEHVLIQ